MKVLPLLFALSAAPTWCDKSYSLTYDLAELSSYEGRHHVLARMETLANTYCTEYLQISSHQVLHLCSQDVVTELANKVDHASFRDLVRQSQNDRLTQSPPTLM